MAESKVGDLTPEMAIAFWPKIEPLLKPLLLIEGNYEPVDILIAHLKGEMKIWASVSDDLEAVMVTQIVTYPRKRVCAVPYIAGTNLNGWKDKFIPMVEAFAKSMNCTRMVGGYRKGWARLAGYSVVGVSLVKDI